MKIAVTLLSPDFEELVDHHVNQMLLNMVDVPVDQLAKYRVLLENELRMLWSNEKSIDETTFRFPDELLYPAYITELVEESNELTLAGHKCVILRGELTSVFALPIIKIHDEASLNFLNDNLHAMDEEEFSLVTSPEYDLMHTIDDEVDDAEH